MKWLKVIALLICSTLLLSGSCNDKDWHKEILLVNNSDKGMVFTWGLSRSDDWTWPCGGSGTWFPQVIHAGGSFLVSEGRGFAGYEGIMNKGQILTIIIGDYDTWDLYWREPCEVIRKNVPILHRYQLSLEDLQQMNWKVIYPPKD